MDSSRDARVFEFGGMRLDVAQRRLFGADGAAIDLPSRAFDLLLYMVERPGNLLDKSELMQAVWPKTVVEEGNLSQSIFVLRRALGDTAEDHRFIVTVAGRGYQFVAKVASLDEAMAQPVPSAAHRRWLLPFLLGLTAALAALFFWRRFGVQDFPPASSLRLADDRAIAVLPLTPATQDEASQSIAPIVTDLIRTRLAAIPGLLVIAESSVDSAIDGHPDDAQLARKLGVSYVIKGEVAGQENRLRMNVRLIDTQSGKPLWQASFDRPTTDLASLNEDIARRTSVSLDMTPEEASTRTSQFPIDIAAYRLYLEGKRLMATKRAPDADAAAAIFSRVTALDPNFARGYYAYGQALLMAVDLGARPMTKQLEARAAQALNRAIELNPALGEAWTQLGRIEDDPKHAERLYQKGLRLAPADDEGVLRYSDLLYILDRRGEAMALVEHARRYNPLSPVLRWREAQLLIGIRGDVPGHERLLREGIALEPNFATLLRDLAASRYLWSGEFADAARWQELAMIADPVTENGRGVGVSIYLDMADVDSAIRVLDLSRRPDEVHTRYAAAEIALYRRDVAGAARIARAATIARIGTREKLEALARNQRAYALFQELYYAYWFGANAIRDDAIATGRIDTALPLIEDMYTVYAGTSPMRNRGLVITYAHTLILAGQTQRGRALARALLTQLDAEEIGRPVHWFSAERAAVFALLGENERALDELAQSQRMNRFAGWWYTADRDPVFNAVRSDARFKALVAQAARHGAEQRAMLDAMRRQNSFPGRDAADFQPVAKQESHSAR